jgi:hypothetical protein
MFELNGDAKVTAFKDINTERSAIVVDDFYRDPDEVRELALSLKYDNNPGLVAGFPGVRCSLDTPEVKEKLYNLYLDLCSNKLWKLKVQKTKLLDDGSFKIPLPRKNRPFDIDEFNRNWDNQGFIVNCTDDSFIKKNPLAGIPHQDYYADEPISTYQFGSVIYLNTPDECAGGTNLYSFGGEMSISSDCRSEWMRNMAEIYDIKGPVLTSLPEEQQVKYLQEKVRENNPYKVEFEAEMKYNRMVLYQSDVLHGMNADLGMFTDYHRLNQVFFL